MENIEWIWDDAKAAMNLAKHRLRFSTALRIFEDPLTVSRPDPHPDGDRIQTIGEVGFVTLFIVHTWPKQIGGKLIGRIISARRATAQERKAYEEGSFESDLSR